MRLAYIAVISDFRKRIGLTAKTFAQLRLLREAGAEIFPLIVLDSQARAEFERIYPGERALFIDGYRKGSIPSILLYQRRLYGALQQELRSRDFDLIYMRYPDSDWNLAGFARQFSGKIVFEHHAKESEALAALVHVGKWSARLHYTLEYLSEAVFSKWVFPHVLGCVGVTEEITAYEKARSGNRGLSVATIPNGADCASMPQRTPPSFDGRNVNLLFVADIRPYHGLDRLLHALAAYRGGFQFKLHIAGRETPLMNGSVCRLAEKLGLGEKLVFAGEKRGSELDAMFDCCHIAVGCLGLHRFGLVEGANIKIREYAARGIPFIMSNIDTDLRDEPDMAPYFLKVPTGDEPLDLAPVAAFAERVCADAGHPSAMRAFALRKMDMRVKARQLLDFLESIAGGRNVRH